MTCRDILLYIGDKRFGVGESSRRPPLEVGLEFFPKGQQAL